MILIVCSLTRGTTLIHSDKGNDRCYLLQGRLHIEWKALCKMFINLARHKHPTIIIEVDQYKGWTTGFLKWLNTILKEQQENTRESKCLSTLCDPGQFCQLTTPCPAHFRHDCIGKNLFLLCWKFLKLMWKNNCQLYAFKVYS